MKVIQEFQEFAVKGNVIEMAAGIIVGGAFGKVVSSLVNDILLPPIGLLLAGVNVSEMAVVLKAATEETAAVTINYGRSIQTMIDFLIMSWAVFIMVKTYNAIRRQWEREAQPEPANV